MPNEDLILAPAAHVVVRDSRSVQCGIDARRAGIVEVAHPRAVAAALAGARRATPRPELIERLRAAGLPRLAAASLVGELVEYRVLRRADADRAPITVLGSGRLARLTAALLREDGLAVRRPPGGSPGDARGLYGLRGPVLLVDSAAQYGRLVPALLRHCPTVLPTLLLGAQGVIGPARIEGAGPCPVCYVLHRNEEDPRWYRVLTQVTDPGYGPALHATAARLSACGAWLAGATPEPPGHPGMALGPGEVLNIDPYRAAGMERRAALRPHPRCVLCGRLGR